MERREHDVVVVSTHTIDRLPLPDGSVREIPGGPARYLGEALDRLSRPWSLITGERALVDVVPGPEGEEYVIPALPPIDLPGPLRAPAVFLSPIIGEVNPLRVPEVEGMLAVDLQGFVRMAGRSSAEPVCNVDLGPLLQRCAVVKASPEELRRLSPASRVLGPETILLVTRGREGAEIRQGGRAWHVPAEPVDVPHSIGAGDTYLAAFVVGLLRGLTAEEAAAFGAHFVAGVLRERL